MSRRTIYSREYETLLGMLRKAREDTGYTQADIAKKLSMSQANLSKYERGELRLDVIQLRDWCRALKVSFVRFVREFDRRLGG